MAKIRVHSFRDLMYKAEILFAYGCTVDEFDEELSEMFEWLARKEDYPAWGACSLRFVAPNGTPYYAIWIRHADSLDGLVHEIAHTKQKVFADRDLETGGEAEAYYQEYLFRECYSRIKGV